MQRSAGKPWIVAFVWMSTGANHPQHTDTGGPAGQCVRPRKQTPLTTCPGEMWRGSLARPGGLKRPQIEISLSYVGHAWKFTAGTRRSRMLRTLRCQRRRHLYRRRRKRNKYHWFKERKGLVQRSTKMVLNRSWKGMFEVLQQSNQGCRDNTFKTSSFVYLNWLNADTIYAWLIAVTCSSLTKPSQHESEKHPIQSFTSKLV